MGLTRGASQKGTTVDPSPPTEARAAFRADIQGMRGVAVLAVLVFHADLPLPGGFLGVDVFFVISGFVITGMLLREWSTAGRIDLGNFYRRRIRRLSPAAGLTIVVVGLSALLLLPPTGASQSTAATGLGAIALVANWVIASKAGGYFALGSATNPLRNLWSLSVEEQFYLVFPTLLLLALAFGRRAGRARLAATLAISAVFLASFALIRGASLPLPEWLFGFYSPLNRAWEFAAGALVALMLSGRHTPQRLGQIAAILGVVGLAISFTLLGEETPTPGKWTLLPVLSSAALIFGGGTARPGVVTELLSQRVLVAAGNYSYSLYLWHWPVIVLAVAIWPGHRSVPILATVFSCIPALLAYHWVEAPMRRHPITTWRMTLRRFLPSFVVPALACAGTLVVATHVILPAFTTGRIAAIHPAPPGGHTFIRVDTATPSCPAPEIGAMVVGHGYCLQTHPEKPMTVALLGDSHAEHLINGFATGMPDTNVGLFSLHTRTLFGGPQKLATATEAIATNPDVQVVVISMFWSEKDLERRPDNLGALRASVTRLTESGKSVLLTDGSPRFPFQVFQCEYRIAPIINASRCTTPVTYLRRYRQHEVAILNSIAADTGATVIPLMERMCPGEECSMLVNGVLGYYDGNHFNWVGSEAAFSIISEAEPLAQLR